MKKRVISTLLALCMVLTLLPSMAFAAEAASGTCGDNVTWTWNSGTLTISGNGAMWDYVSRDEVPWSSWRTQIKAVVLNDGVISIGEHAFVGCHSLTSITIPDDVTSIGHAAFLGCYGLTSVTILGSVASIGDAAFADCNRLRSITIPDSVTSIGQETFRNCDSLTSITIPDAVTSIGVGAFLNCIGLTSVTIPDSVTGIEEYAFAECHSLTDVYYAGSEGQWKEITIESGNEPLTSAAIHFSSADSSDPSAPAAPTTPSGDYIYDVPDPGEEMILPADRLNTVTDSASAVSAVKALTDSMTAEQKQAPACIDLATLYAETAAAKAASQKVDNGDLLINAALLSSLQSTSTQAISAVEGALTSGGVTTARELSHTVILTTDETDVTVCIDPDVLTTDVDKVRVETPGYALTFKLSDLAPDLTQTLTFTAKSAAADSAASSAGVSSFSGSADGQGLTTISRSILANAAVPAVEIDMTGGKTTNFITASLPKAGGDTTYQAVASADGAATASKYNPATTQMDGKVNTSGKYTVMTNEKDFTDISNKSAEMQAAIRYLASKGIINGTTATTFNPDGSISRAEIATLLVKALGKLDSTATTSFSDVSKSNWYYTAAASSQRHGLINGYEDNTFRGTNNISKVQIVAVSSRVLTSEMNYKTPGNPSSYLSKYSDSIATWAQSEVALATRENLVAYRTDGTFSGDKNMTRGDAAVIIYRLFQRIW